MSKATLVWISFAIVRIFSNVAFAQGPPSPDRSASAPTEDGPRGFQKMMLLTMLAHQTVQAELNLTDDQKEIVRNIKPPKPIQIRPNKSPEEIAKDKETLRVLQDRVDTFTKSLNSEQRARLQQLKYQTLRTSAFSDPVVQARLGFTDEQKTELKSLIEELRKATQSIPRTDRESMQKTHQLNMQYVDKVTALFTDSQERAWADLTGKRFNLDFIWGR